MPGMPPILSQWQSKVRVSFTFLSLILIAISFFPKVFWPVREPAQTLWVTYFRRGSMTLGALDSGISKAFCYPSR